MWTSSRGSGSQAHVNSKTQFSCGRHKWTTPKTMMHILPLSTKCMYKFSLFPQNFSISPIFLRLTFLLLNLRSFAFPPFAFPPALTMMHLPFMHHVFGLHIPDASGYEHSRWEDEETRKGLYTLFAYRS